MKSAGRKTFLIAGVIIMGLLGAIGAYFQGWLGPREDGEIRYSEVSLPEDAEYPGVLIGVSYDFSAGSMENRTEFSADITPEEVVSCDYYVPLRRSIVHKEHRHISRRRWEQLEKIIKILYQELKPYDAEDMSPADEERPPLLDSGYRNTLKLTWSTDDGNVTVTYAESSDRRFTTLYLLLREIAHPVGRRIPWYEGP